VTLATKLKVKIIYIYNYFHLYTMYNIALQPRHWQCCCFCSWSYCLPIWFV